MRAGVSEFRHFCLGYANMYALLSDVRCDGQFLFLYLAMLTHIDARGGHGLSGSVRLSCGHGADPKLVQTLHGGQDGIDRDKPMTPVGIIAVDIVLATSRGSLHRVQCCW